MNTTPFSRKASAASPSDQTSPLSIHPARTQEKNEKKKSRITVHAALTGQITPEYSGIIRYGVLARQNWGAARE